VTIIYLAMALDLPQWHIMKWIKFDKAIFGGDTRKQKGGIASLLGTRYADLLISEASASPILDCWDGLCELVGYV
jgi:hypothetical protein